MHNFIEEYISSNIQPFSIKFFFKKVMIGNNNRKYGLVIGVGGATRHYFIGWVGS